jgi:hypothetical protein
MIFLFEKYSTADTVHLANTFAAPHVHKAMILGFVLNSSPYKVEQIGIRFAFP